MKIRHQRRPDMVAQAFNSGTCLCLDQPELHVEFRPARAIPRDPVLIQRKFLNPEAGTDRTMLMV